jgi:hypothetical protein
VPALESQIDDLYRGALDEFTAARNALAKTLTGADAARVRKLAKPSIVPWTVNQVYWRARSTYDRLLTSGARLRKAQIDALEGRRADVRAAGEAHRTAIANTVKEATRIASAANVHPAVDALTRTVEALSLMKEPPAPPGRLTEPLQPAGFEALSGIPVREARGAREPRERGEPEEPHAPERGEPRGPSEPHEPNARQTAQARKREREEARQREAAARAHAAAVKKAEATLARAQAAAALAREAAAHADKAVADAEAALKGLQAPADR